MNQPQQEFLAEIEERIERLFAVLEDLHSKIDEGPSRRQLLEQIFRDVHSVKGLASSAGLDSLRNRAHEFENLLSAIRSGQIALDDSVLDSLDDAAHELSLMLNPARAKTSVTAKAIGSGYKSPTADASGENAHYEFIRTALPLEVWQSLVEQEKRNLAEIIVEGARLFLVETSFDLTNFDEQFQRLKEKLEERGEVVSKSPRVDTERSNKINFRILFASELALPQVISAIHSFPNATTSELIIAAPSGGDIAPARSSISESTSGKFIRVHLDDLDQLISSAHRLFKRTENMLKLARENVADTLKAAEYELRQSFMALEDEIIRLRMVSVERALQRAVRAGRAAARPASKEIEFEVVGGQLRLDRFLHDAISDPLIHLVRNSVDHGIETPEERQLVGKRGPGRIRIEVAREGSNTRISVADDGRGIDPFVISQAAAELGVIEKGITLDMENSLRLIFRSGFSTSASISSISGRGVGLDVVETAVEQVGGEVRVSSEVGKGTVFEIRLPITFGLLRSTIVMSANYRYCFDANEIVGTEVIDAGRVDNVGVGKILRLQNGVFPVVHLRKLLGQSLNQRGQDTTLHVLLCEFHDQRPGARPNTRRRAGLVVDSVEQTQDVLVRNLGRYGGRWYGVAGATELRDGSVALVMDLPRLLSRSSEIGPEV